MDNIKPGKIGSKNGPVCWGNYADGTACGKCYKCKHEDPDIIKIKEREKEITMGEKRNEGLWQDRQRIGRIGEALVEMEFAKIDILTQKIHQGLKCGDILVEGGLTVEVKTSVYKELKSRAAIQGYNVISTHGWGVAALQRGSYDFLAIVLLEEDYSLFRYMIYAKDDPKVRVTDTLNFTRPTEEEKLLRRRRTGSDWDNLPNNNISIVHE